MTDTAEQTGSRRDKLRRFLAENALNEAGRELTPAAMALLEPLFRNAESGRYPLEEGTVELERETLTALRSVFGEDRVKRVILVSRGRPFPKPDWMSLQAYEASLEASFGGSFGASLFYYLGFVLAGDRERVGQLTPLVQLLHRALPVGEKSDEPGVWLVLVA